MGQEEVLEILRRKKQATLKDISKELNANIYSIWQSLMKLARHGEIEAIKIKKQNIERGRKEIILWRLKGGEEK